MKFNLKNKLKIILRPSRGVFYFLKKIFWPIINFFRKIRLRQQENIRFHFGCSNIRLNDFINVDCRFTSGLDITVDLNKFRFKPSSAALVFSNAFFEHLFRLQRVNHLQRVHDLLSDDGAVCYIGLPYFKNIAKFYLEKGPGTAGATFDLYNVYRYTHGDPDRMIKDGWYFEQLHKSLFDEAEIAGLLKDSGFNNYCIFTYAFPGDYNEMPVCCGFYAAKNGDTNHSVIQSAAKDFLLNFSGRFIVMDSLNFINPYENN